MRRELGNLRKDNSYRYALHLGEQAHDQFLTPLNLFTPLESPAACPVSRETRDGAGLATEMKIIPILAKTRGLMPRVSPPVRKWKTF